MVYQKQKCILTDVDIKAWDQDASMVRYGGGLPLGCRCWLPIVSSYGGEQRGSKLSPVSCKGTKSIYEDSTLLTSSNPNDLLMTPLHNTIALKGRISSFAFWRGHVQSIKPNVALTHSFIQHNVIRASSVPSIILWKLYQ